MKKRALTSYLSAHFPPRKWSYTYAQCRTSVQQYLHASLREEASPNILSTSFTGSRTTTAPSQLLLLHETRRCSRPLHKQPISAYETTASQKLRNSLLCDILHHLPTIKVSPHVWKPVDESEGEFPSPMVTKLRLSATWRRRVRAFVDV